MTKKMPVRNGGWMNTQESYGRITRFLHWLLAVLIIAMLTVGLLLDTFHSHTITQIHKLTGLFVLALTLTMIVWNALNIRPGYLVSMPKWQLIVAKSVQHTMLLCALIMPLSGWIFATAAGKPPQIGHVIFAMPFIGQNPSLSAFFRPLHTYVAYLLIGLVSLHTLASLFHHYIRKDNILLRMLRE